MGAMTRPVYDLEDLLRMSIHEVRAKRLERETMSTAIEKNGEPQAIVVHRDVSGPLEFSPTQRAMIRDTYANGATEKEFQVLLEIAKLRRLNPLLRQIHFVKRWNKQLGRDVWAAQVSVDGLRAIAERTGKYDGQDEPEFGPIADGFPEWCKVKVYRKDWTRPAVGLAYWSEYVQKSRDGGPTRFWADMPRVMIAKCAEAIAMRKAFPEDLGGLYTDEEMQQADNTRELHHGQELHHNPAELPGDDRTDRENETYSAIMAELAELEHTLQKANPVTYDLLLQIRSRMGARGGPSVPMAVQMSELNRGDDISPGQKKELGKVWNRVDRQVKRYEGMIQKPSVEASFDDGGVELERQPGEDDR